MPRAAYEDLQKRSFIIKCGLSLENMQPSPFENEAPIWEFNILVYWSLSDQII